MKKIKNFFNLLIGAIYPRKCICCAEILNSDSYICEGCNKNIERVNLDNICLNCGIEKEFCECNNKVFRFTSVISSFKNIGIARNAYYSYKFHRKQHYAMFFSDEIINSIKHCYSDIGFDLICIVPSYNKSGYDHCGYIAGQVSKKLEIPYDKDLLSCVKRTKKQHKSTIEERLRNVDGKYRANCRVDNKKILLIDDIKTTGATLDECARMLLFAGAQDVYCVTVLGSIGKEKIEK